MYNLDIIRHYSRHFVTENLLLRHFVTATICYATVCYTTFCYACNKATNCYPTICYSDNLLHAIVTTIVTVNKNYHSYLLSIEIIIVT